MNRAKKWSEIKHKSTPERRDRARAELNEALALYELRKARDMTQVQLAQALDVTQPAVSRIEHSTDVYLSTLRSYVEALGGMLEIRARFGDTVITIDGFEELDEQPHDARTSRAARTAGDPDAAVA